MKIFIDKNTLHTTSFIKNGEEIHVETLHATSTIKTMKISWDTKTLHAMSLPGKVLSRKDFMQHNKTKAAKGF